MALSFANTELNNRFTINSEHDVDIDTPDGYKGKLTMIRKPETVEGMIKRGSNLVSAKQGSFASGTDKNKTTEK